jgi:hypothetical protein
LQIGVASNPRKRNFEKLLGRPREREKSHSAYRRRGGGN